MDTFYNYVIKSLKDGKFYIGLTSDLNKRMNDHKKGKVDSTKYRRPFLLVYYEVSFNYESAVHREKYLKTTYGHRYLRNRLNDNPQGLPL